MEKVGRKTDLTDKLFKQIKQSILDGNDLRKTAKVCNINEGTLYVWHSDNYLNIKDKVEGWKRDCKLNKADRNINKILDLQVGKEHTKVVADMSKFVKETLDKPNYSKRTENTGADGKDLKIEIVNYKNEDNTTT